MSMRYPGGLIATSPVNARYPSGVWTQAQAAPYQAQNVWTRDQFWPYTTLLLQGDGATNGAQNNTFLDSSSNNFTITRNGNTTQGSFTPYEQDGYWSNYLSGSGDVNAPSNAAFTYGTSDFTIEGWFFITGRSGPNSYEYLFAQGSSTGTSSLGLYREGGVLKVWNGSAVITGTTTLALNTWNHIALSRSGTTMRLFLNGVQEGSATNSNSISTGSTYGISVGRWTEIDTNYIVGYVSNFRVVKGTAVYTSAFTPPAAPLTAITNTSLLTCQSNRFKDNSTNNFTLTVNGTPSVQAFQPFPGATTWSASVLGGSGYFDGSGDFLATPSNVAFVLGSSGDFTVECWMYPIGTQSLYSTVVSTYTDFNTGGGYLNKWHLGYSSTTTLSWYDSSGTNSINSTNHPINSWSHVAVVRSGSTITMYVNGVSVGTQTTNQSYTSQSPVQVGFVTNAAYFNGYISNIRVVKGSAVYTSNFTPPTAPLTAITNTSLLLSTTNAGIYDNSMMNNLETVGNAQVSTSVVKYGTGSMAFDGTGDWLLAADSQNFNVGSGDWTIEAWLYINTAKNYNGFYGKRQAGQFGLTLQIDSSGVLSISASTTGSSWALAAASLGGGYSAGAWMHVAVTRSGNTITGWKNGVSTGTQTLSGSIFAAAGYGATIGSANDTGQDLNGYLDDFRITKAARYIGNFTPPPARLPAQ